jgi:hypothetical protein
VPVLWITEKKGTGFRDKIAWWPVRAFDNYSLRWAWVWLREVRVSDDGKVTFSSFWC